MRPDETKMTDQQLNTLLARLKEEPVPTPALDASWRAIDARLEWRKPEMHPLAFSKTLIQPKWAAAIAAAALLCVAFGVGKVQLGDSSGEPAKFADSGVRASPAPILANGYGEAGVSHEEDAVDTLLRINPSVAKSEDVISDTPLGGTATARRMGPGAGGGGYRDTAGNKAKEAERGEALYDRVAPVKAPPASEPAAPPPAAKAPDTRSRSEGKSKPADASKRGKDGGQNALANPDMLPVPGNADKNLGATGKPGEAQPPVQSSQKIIKTAELSLEIKKFDEASREVDRLVTRYRGFYADNRVTQNEDGTASATIVIRVPQGSFEALYAELKKLGRVKAENAKGEDVTEKFTDLSARIRNAQHLENNLLVLLDEKKKGGKMSEILEVQRELAKTREEIEKMQGSMRVMENLIEFGTIYLTLAERSRTVPSGSLNVEVKDAAAADRELDRAVGEVAGQVASRNSVKRPDGTLMITATLKAPMTRFGELVEKVKALGVRVDREDVRGYNLAAIGDDAGAKDVLATVNLILFEASLQKPGGNARIQVETLEGAAKAIGDILREVEGTQVSRQESRQGDQAVATYLLRVSRAKFPSLVLALSRIGTVETKQFVGADVVTIDGPAAKVQCDLEVQVHERERETPGGSATVTTTRMTEAAEKLAILLKSVDGQVTSHTESKQADGTTHAQYQVQVKRGKFAQLDAGLGTLGRLQHKEVHGTDLAEVKGAAADTFCALSLAIQERRAPLPTASLEVIVDNAKEAEEKLVALCKAAKAETGVPKIDKNRDKSVVQTWQPRLPVEAFDSFVAQVQELGEARGSINPLRPSEEEKPDLKALTDVTVRLVQLSPFTRPVERQEMGSLAGALRAARDGFYDMLRYVVVGLGYVAVPAIVVVLIFVLIGRASRRKAAAKAPEAESSRKE